jgi:hypothetical protein
VAVSEPTGPAGSRCAPRGLPYPKVRAFREALERRDYPAKQTTEERPTGARDTVSHPAGSATGQEQAAEER